MAAKPESKYSGTKRVSQTKDEFFVQNENVALVMQYKDKVEHMYDIEINGEEKTEDGQWLILMGEPVDRRNAKSSTSSASTTDYEPVVRGRGRRRGGKANPSTAVSGKGIVRGRGRKSARGKRKQTGAFHLEDNEKDRLKQLKMMRKRKADEFVDSLTVDGCRKVLKSVVEKTPNLILTVADEIQKERGASEDPNVPDQPEWCICTRCREMPSDVSRVCCNMV